MTPAEALEAVILFGLVNSMRRGPGQIVGRASTETREALQALTSDEARGMRADLFLPKGAR